MVSPGAFFGFEEFARGGGGGDDVMGAGEDENYF